LVFPEPRVLTQHHRAPEQRRDVRQRHRLMANAQGRVLAAAGLDERRGLRILLRKLRRIRQLPPFPAEGEREDDENGREPAMPGGWGRVRCAGLLAGRWFTASR